MPQQEVRDCMLQLSCSLKFIGYRISDDNQAHQTGFWFGTLCRCIIQPLAGLLPLRGMLLSLLLICSNIRTEIATGNATGSRRVGFQKLGEKRRRLRAVMCYL